MKLTNESKVGLMVSLVIIMLVVLTIKSGDFKFARKGYMVKVHFRNVDGVSENAPVMVNGLEVGYVKDINIMDGENETRMELVVWLDEKAKIKSGAEAYVKSMGFLGEKYVGIVSGKQQGYVLEGDIIVGQDPADLDQLLSDGQEIATQLKEVSRNINERLKVNEERIDNIFANFDTSMENFVSITDNIDERLKLNEGNIDEMMVNLKSASVNLDEFTYDLKMNPWKLMYRPKEKKKKGK